jgi:hypothetical protein
MLDRDFYLKIDECIARFENGKERYRTSPTVNMVVQILVRDTDPYKTIDRLCQIVDDQSQTFRQYDINATPMFTKKQIFSVKDKLPNTDGGTFLVYAPKSFPKNSRWVVAEYDDDVKGFYSESSDAFLSDVTHWAYLPDEPEI